MVNSFIHTSLMPESQGLAYYHSGRLYDQPSLVLALCLRYNGSGRRRSRFLGQALRPQSLVSIFSLLTLASVIPCLAIGDARVTVTS